MNRNRGLRREVASDLYVEASMRALAAARIADHATRDGCPAELEAHARLLGRQAIRRIEAANVEVRQAHLRLVS